MFDSPSPAVPSRPSWRWPSLAGTVVGVACAVLAVTPSLLPRPTVFQGLLAAVAFGLGYALGVAVLTLLRTSFRFPPRRLSAPRWAWILFAVLLLLSFSGLAGVAVLWQNDVRALVRMAPLPGPSAGMFFAVFLAVTAVLFAIGAAVRRLYLRLRRRGGVLVSLTVSGVTVVAALACVVGLALAAVDRIYADRNGSPSADVSEPASEFRSAGADSSIAWETLGRHGSAFVGGGPSADDIARLTQAPALEPIRVYAGVESAPTLEERAALVVDELERTHAFDREVLVVATTTGSGWLEAQTVDAIEYLHGGDTAIASVQYAYTPSWVSFLFDQDAPIEAARALFTAVEAAWSTLPADDRPILVTYGLSLGAHGSQAVFTDLHDVRVSTDGALFVGTPHSSSLWQELTAARDASSPVWQPVLDDGEAVRWYSRLGDEGRLMGEWTHPRVLYLQHATDPITWLTTDLVWQRPEWLTDAQRSDDISPDMRWIPGITALQVVLDMLVSEAVPASYGHNFGDVVLMGWQQVTGPGVLDDAAFDRVQAELETYARIPVHEE